MRRIGLIIALLLVAAACSAKTVESIEVTGSTGYCTESGTAWSGEAPAGVAVPGLVLERTVTCPIQKMSDERLSGVYSSEIRCEFSKQGDATVGDCVTDSVLANEGGTWEATGSPFTITVIPGEPTVVAQGGSQLGTGDYEGLRFVSSTGGTDYPWPITGTIEPTD